MCGGAAVGLAGGNGRGARTAVVIATGAISLDDALAEIERLGPVVGFLAAVLVLAQMCDDAGLFRASGSWLAHAAAARPRRLLMQVFVVA
jgi:arsenical pump membrane protein